jgi:hypothetical protein
MVNGFIWKSEGIDSYLKNSGRVVFFVKGEIFTNPDNTFLRSIIFIECGFWNNSASHLRSNR